MKNIKSKKKQSLPHASEEQEQMTVVAWCKAMRIPVVHIPNEGKRSAIEGARMKRAGLSPGFPDLFIPKAVCGYHGLFIEMKVGTNKPTENQKAWLKLLSDEGYATCVRWGANAAIESIKKYLNQKKEDMKE